MVNKENASVIVEDNTTETDRVYGTFEDEDVERNEDESENNNENGFLSKDELCYPQLVGTISLNSGGRPSGLSS